MGNTSLELYSNIHRLRHALGALFTNNKGQDLIEYALVLALVALAAATTMNTVAQKINQTFTNIGAKVSAYTS
jgi:pilus assembly protein Flp/PilA